MRLKLALALAACLLTSPAWAVDPTARQAYPTAGDHGSAIVTVGGGLDINGFAVPCGSSTVVTGCGVGSSAQSVDPSNASWGGVIPITPGTPFTVQRGMGFICTTSGNVTLTYVDGSTSQFPIIASASRQIFTDLVTNITLGSGTAGTFWSLK